MKFGQQKSIDTLVNDLMVRCDFIINAADSGVKIKSDTARKLAVMIGEIDAHISQGFPLPMRWQGPRRTR